MEEKHHVRTDSPLRWAVETLERFNETLRPGEEPRRLLSVEELHEGDPRREGDYPLPPLRHLWRKTNLVTQMNKSGRGSFDAYRCEDCGATGKRFTLGGDVVLDKKRLNFKPCPGNGVRYALRRRRT